MPRGLGDIPELRLEVLSKFVTKFTADPGLMLMNMFPSSDSPSSTIKWESHVGSRGMVPFKSPGDKTHVTHPLGVAQNSAEAAFWGEKEYFDEEFLNNLRKEGTESQYLSAQQRLARELNSLIIRANRRREWMFAKMMVDGSITYSVTGGLKFTVDYDIPTANKVTLTTDYKWQNGTSRDIMGDIITGKRVISDANGGAVTKAICNSQVLQYMAEDPSILTLLQKTTFGEGDLFKSNRNGLVGVNPNIIGSLLNIPELIIYDEKYEVRQYLTAVVTADSTTSISVGNAADFEAGGTLKFHDVSAGTTETETISSVDVEAGTITVSTAPSTSYKAGEDYVSMTKSYIPDDKFIMVAPTVEGQGIAEYKRAPYGLNRGYGMRADRKEEWDPEGVWIRVQDKGLPVLYQRDAIYILDVN